MSWKEELVQALTQAVNGEKDEVIRSYQTMTGLSSQSLYRIAKQNGYKSGRKKRPDKGSCSLTDHQIMHVFTLIKESARERKGAIMPVEVALDMAIDNGIIDPGAVSVDRMQAILRDRGINAAALNAPKPRIQMCSPYPNYVHQLDASVCIQYYLRPGHPLQILPENLFYKNKFENFAKVKRKIIRWVLTDHCSGSIYVKYYQSKGEQQADLFDFLINAWGMKGPKFPFRGVPKMLMLDKGPANISHAIVELLHRLDVEIPESNPGNPARNGSVEKAQDIVERQFESRLRFQPASSIEELNAHVLDWATMYNATAIHNRHRMTRTACWLLIRQEQLRELPDMDILYDCYKNPEEPRGVSPRYSISFRAREYDLRHIPALGPGMKVNVVLRPYSWPEIGVIFREEEYTVNPIPQGDLGFRADAAMIGQEFKAMPESPVQQAIKRAENLAYGDEREKGQVPFAGLRVFGHQADKVDITYMPRKGVPHPITVDREGIVNRLIPITDLFRQMLNAGGPISPEINRRVREAYGSSISSAEADRLVAEYEETGRVTVSAPVPQTAAGGGAC